LTHVLELTRDPGTSLSSAFANGAAKNAVTSSN